MISEIQYLMDTWQKKFQRKRVKHPTPRFGLLIWFK